MADYQVKIVLVRKANIIVFTLINIPTSGVKDREVISNDSGKTGEQTGSRGGRSGGGGEGVECHQSHLREIFTVNLNLILILAIMILLLSGVAETGKRNANASFPIHIN